MRYVLEAAMVLFAIGAVNYFFSYGNRRRRRARSGGAQVVYLDTVQKRRAQSR